MSGRGSTRARRRWRLFVLERDGWSCQVPADDDPTRPCAAFADHADHVVALVDGGAELDPDNGRAACAFHNLSRGARSDEDARASRLRRKISGPGVSRTAAGLEDRPSAAAGRWSW